MARWAPSPVSIRRSTTPSSAPVTGRIMVSAQELLMLTLTGCRRNREIDGAHAVLVPDEVEGVVGEDDDPDVVEVPEKGGKVHDDA